MDDLDLGATIKGFSPGQKVFGRFTLVRILGRGGMGVVWLARDDKLERDVALKFLPEVMMGDKLALTDLKRETRRSLELTHSHIVRIYDFMEDGRTAAIAMEYIAGETLTNTRVDRPGHCYEPADITKWVTQLCAALDYAHGKARVVHRDLKPANLMIDAAGDLKVTDFGIATSIADSVSRVSRQAGSSGTPVYMAPQQMMGEKPTVTDDIYALGATLYDLLTGKPPFHSGNIVLQVQSKTAPTLAERRAELGVSGKPLPPQWEQTVAACLAKEPKDRPQSAGEVAHRLGLAGAPPAAQAGPGANLDEGSTARDLPKSVRSAPVHRSRKGLLAGLTTAALILAATGYYFGVMVPEQKQRLAEQQRVEVSRQAQERERQREAEAATRAAAEARTKAEREQDEYTAVLAKIAAVHDAAPRAELEAMERVGEEYLLKAPERFKAGAKQALDLRRNAWLAYEAAHRPGSLIVETEPAGATVTLYPRNERKTSPAVFKEIAPGEVSYRVELEGYEPQDANLAIQPGGEMKAGLVKLVSLTGTAVITSVPTGTKVAIDGNSRHFEGVTPFRQEGVPPGSYAVTFQRAKRPPVGKTLVIKRSEVANLAADLTGVTLDIRSEPSGAQVSLNDEAVGLTPLTLTDQVPGEYRLILTKDDFEPVSRTLSAGSNTTVSEKLVPAAPKITRLVLYRARGSILKGGTGYVTIKLDGQAVGNLSNGSYWVKEVSSGTHTLAFRVLGITVANTPVELKEGMINYVEALVDGSSGSWRPANEADAMRVIKTLEPDSSSPSDLGLPRLKKY